MHLHHIYQAACDLIILIIEFHLDDWLMCVW